MSIATAIAALDAPAPPQAHKSQKKGRISKRLRQAIKLLVTGECKTQKAAAERVGMHEVSLCVALRKPDVRVFRDQCVRQTISDGTMRASSRLIELIDASSEHVAADVAKHVLAIEGIKPANSPQVSVNIELKAGYVIDLTGRDRTYEGSMSRPNVNETKDITPGGE